MYNGSVLRDMRHQKCLSGLCKLWGASSRCNLLLTTSRLEKHALSLVLSASDRCNTIAHEIGHACLRSNKF